MSRSPTTRAPNPPPSWSSAYITQTADALDPRPLFYSGVLNNPAAPIFHDYGLTGGSPRTDFIGGAYDSPGTTFWAGDGQAAGPAREPPRPDDRLRRHAPLRALDAVEPPVRRLAAATAALAMLAGAGQAVAAPAPLSAEGGAPNVASSYGSGAFGQWTVDAHGLPAYRYEIDRADEPDRSAAGAVGERQRLEPDRQRPRRGRRGQPRLHAALEPGSPLPVDQLLRRLAQPLRRAASAT